MKRKLFYTKYALRCFRIISILCAIFLLVIEILNLIYPIKNKYISPQNFLTDVTNILAFSFFVVTIIFPHKFAILSFVAYFYSFTIIPLEPENYMGILMFFLGTALLFARGLLKKHKKFKMVILGIVLTTLCFSHLRFGLNNFINYFVNTVGGVLVISLYSFLMKAYYLNTFVYEDKRLNIASFPKLTERDCRILQRIQKGEKYSTIAKDENITEGSLKNRLHFVFITMETGDKQGFLSYYDDWNLYYALQDVEKK